MKRIDHYREAVWNAADLAPLEKLLLLAMTRVDYATGTSVAAIRGAPRSPTAPAWPTRR